MELPKYREIKALPDFRITKVSNEMVAVTTPRFDPANGAKIDVNPETFTVKQAMQTRTVLVTERDKLNDHIQQLDEFIADIQAALVR